MPRRCLSLLLILGLIASPLAAMPHAHAEMSNAEKCEHDQTPHVHTHSHGHHHHHGHDAQNERAATPKNSSKAPSDDASDDGALRYFHGAICFEIQSEALCKVNQVEELHAKTFSVAAINWLEANLAPMTAIRPSLWQPPDAVLDESTIYLTLRNLRI
jgi:hypothetical protein